MPAHTRRRMLYLLGAGSAGVLAGCAATASTDRSAAARPAAAPALAASASPAASAGAAGGAASAGAAARAGAVTAAGNAPGAVVAPAGLPGVGPRTAAAIADRTTQAVLVTGDGRDLPTSQVTLYQRADASRSWTPAPGAPWPAHNALHGWTDHHMEGDLRSPSGVYTLSDAGGLDPDPGSLLPYDHSTGFTIGGTGFDGEPLAGAFDYVIAIDYNRKRGTSPLDWTRPMGAVRGGGIWLHCDHGGPSHGCVTVARAHLRTLLRTLDPARHPVVVMGDPEALAR